MKRTSTHLLLCPVLIILWSSETVEAQSSAVIDHHAKVLCTAQDQSPKPIFSELVNSFNATQLEYRSETGTLQFSSTVEVSKERLQQLVGPYGFYIVGLQRKDQVNSEWSVIEGETPFPVKGNSGSEREDNDRYDHDKAHWIATHPEPYEAISNGERSLIRKNEK